MSEWWLGLGPAEASVECGGSSHRLVWEAGSLRAVEHDDAEAERTLAALSGTRTACVDVLEAWARHSDDLDVLLLASRGPGDQLAPEDGRMRAYAAQIARTRSRRGTAAKPADARAEIAGLLRLGGGVPEKLVATVAAEWSQRLERVAGRESFPDSRLHAALYGRVLSTLRVWLGEPTLSLELVLVEAPAERSLSRDGGTVLARLPFAWVADVWARGFATVWGRFCLSAEADDEGRWTLETIGPDFRAAQPLRLDLPTGS